MDGRVRAACGEGSGGGGVNGVMLVIGAVTSMRTWGSTGDDWKEGEKGGEFDCLRVSVGRGVDVDGGNGVADSGVSTVERAVT